MSSERVLRRRLTRFLGQLESERAPLIRALRDFRGHGWNPHIFGGTIRELMLKGPSAVPRDVDLVVDQCSVEDIAEEFRPHVRRHTRFGGLHLEVHGWHIDIWPLRETWAFKSGLIYEPSFSRLPETTFLNIEAVAVELEPGPGRGRRVYEHGFFDSICARTLEINLEANPFPELCVARSLVMATKLGFKVGPNLAEYIVRVWDNSSVSDLIQMQASHYGAVILGSRQLEICLVSIKRALELGTGSPIYVPTSRDLFLGQLTLPFSD